MSINKIGTWCLIGSVVKIHIKLANKSRKYDRDILYWFTMQKKFYYVLFRNFVYNNNYANYFFQKLCGRSISVPGHYYYTHLVSLLLLARIFTQKLCKC